MQNGRAEPTVGIPPHQDPARSAPAEWTEEDWTAAYLGEGYLTPALEDYIASMTDEQYERWTVYRLRDLERAAAEQEETP